MVIITGITGQDGSYLAKSLVDQGEEVVGILRAPKNCSYMVGLDFLGLSNKLGFEVVNLTDSAAVKKLINYYKPDKVYNLAAQSSVGKSFVEPYETIYFNSVSVLNLLSAIRNNSPATKFYQASSSEVYGNVDKLELPISGIELPNPISPYGLSKNTANAYVKYFRQHYGLYAVIGTLFNHESALRRDGFVVSKIFNGLLDIRSGIREESLVLGNVNIVRDWGYAPKYVEAMIKILELPDPQDFIVCSGNKMELKKLISLSCEFIGVGNQMVTYDNPEVSRANELNVIYGTNEHTKRVLGWDYNITNEELIELLVKDYEIFRAWKQSL